MLDTKDENKPTPRFIIQNFRTLETKENPNAEREKRGRSHTEDKESECSQTWAAIQIKRQRSITFKILREIIFQPRIVYPSKLWI